MTNKTIAPPTRKHLKEPKMRHKEQTQLKEDHLQEINILPNKEQNAGSSKMLQPNPTTNMKRRAILEKPRSTGTEKL